MDPKSSPDSESNAIIEYFNTHSVIYKNIISPISSVASIASSSSVANASPLIKSAIDIIAEYKKFLGLYTTYTESITDNIKLKNNLPNQQNHPDLYNLSFFQLIHNIVKSNTHINDDTAAQKLINQSKIIISVIDSILLHKLIEKKDEVSSNHGFSSLSSISTVEDLVMNSMSTEMISSISNVASTPVSDEDKSILASTVSTIITTITDLFPNKSTTDASIDTNTVISKVIDSLNTLIPATITDATATATDTSEFATQIKAEFSSLSTDTTSTPQIDNMIEILNQVVTLSCMNIPELKNSIVSTQTTNHGEFIVIGKLYCINGQVIPPNMSDIISIHSKKEGFDKNKINIMSGNTYINTNDKPLANPLTTDNIKDIENKLKIKELCLIDHPPASIVQPRTLIDQPTASKGQPLSIYEKSTANVSGTNLDLNKKVAADAAKAEAAVTKRLTVEAAKAAEAAKATKQETKKSTPSKKPGFGSGANKGGNYTRKITNNTKPNRHTRKSYIYDSLVGDKITNDTGNDSTHE